MRSYMRFLGTTSFLSGLIESDAFFSMPSSPSFFAHNKPTRVVRSRYPRQHALTSVSIEYDDSEAESQFGTKEYWDDMYKGMGDFSSEEYSWYFGFETIKPFFVQYMPLPPKQAKNKDIDMPKVLVPGVGNDPTVLDLYAFGYQDITAFDYSSDAIERQEELLSYNSQAMDDITLLVRDGRQLDDAWTDTFDIIFEKGALDAIYLSGPESGNVERAVEELSRVLKPGGYFMSVSGVVPENLRREMIQDEWEWIRDGSDDLKAGCFVLKRI